MNYLILGGAGFIGSHLAKRLQDEGHSVVIIDSLATSKKPIFETTFVHADIRYLETLEFYIKECDIIYFLAGSLGVEYIDKHPKETFDNNIGLMNKLIPLFEKYKKKVIFSSTSEVYGEGPFAENNNLTLGPPNKLRWGYAAAKLITEFSICSSNFPYLIYRFFNVVGPGQLGEYGMVLPRLIESAKNNQDLIVYGTGKQTRSFCHVKDAVNIMLKLEKVDNEIFNIGSNSPISIEDLAKRVIELSGSQSKIQLKPYKMVFSKNHADIINRVPDLSKLNMWIDYKPKYSLDDIIKDCL